MKYKILWDYGVHEGMKFDDKEFETVDAAVKWALSLNYSVQFLIVNVIAWKAIEEPSGVEHKPTQGV